MRDNTQELPAPREMTPEENEAVELLGGVIMDYVEKSRGSGIPTATVIENLQNAGVHLFNAIRAPLYEQAAEQRRHIKALEAEVEALKTRFA